MTCRGTISPAGAPALKMEQAHRIICSKKTETSKDIFEAFMDGIDNFMEERLFKFLKVAVPVYFGAHAIVFFVNTASGKY